MASNSWLLDIRSIPSTLLAMQLSSLSPHQLRIAADLKEKIDELQVQLSRLMGGDIGARAQAPKRSISAAGRAAISAAARARWAKVKAGKAAQPRKKSKRKISAAGKARLSALAKARWAKAKKMGRTRL